MDKATTRQWVRVGGLLLVLLLVLAGQFWLWPAIRVAAIELHSLRTTEQQQEILEERLEKIVSDREQAEAGFSQLAVIFPEEGNTPQAVERLESVAASAGVRLSVNQIDELGAIEARRGRGLLPVLISFSVTAPVQRLFEFMDRVEHVPELTRVWSFSIKEAEIAPSEEGKNLSGPVLHTLQMRVAFYLQELE